MSRSVEKIRTDVVERNLIREQAGLPLLQADLETERLRQADEQAEFESYFNLNKHRFRHLWSDRSLGYLSRMGIWSSVRTKLHTEWLEAWQVVD
jgi:hypothetical protein